MQGVGGGVSDMLAFFSFSFFFLDVVCWVFVWGVGVVWCGSHGL